MPKMPRFDQCELIKLHIIRKWRLLITLDKGLIYVHVRVRLYSSCIA